MLLQEGCRPTPGKFGRAGIVGGSGVGEKSVSCGLRKNLVVLIILLYGDLKGLELVGRNLIIVFGIMSLHSRGDLFGDIDRASRSVGERRRLEIALKRHHRADLFWMSRREHQGTPPAKTESG